MLRSASASTVQSGKSNSLRSSSMNLNEDTNANNDNEINKHNISESSKSLALRALKAISKSSVSSIQLDEVPRELLYGEHIDLHRWTAILKDSNLKELSEQKHSNKNYFLDSSSPTVIGMFNTFYKPLNISVGLLSLNISNARDITDYGITLIAKNNLNLKQLNISHCYRITDIGLREIGIYCNKLQDLNISSCYEITGTGLVAIAEKCRHLLMLDVSKCKKLENWSLKKVFYDCIQLEDVNISYLEKVCDEEVRVLAQNCVNLITLRAVECPYISDESIQVLTQHCFDIDLIDVTRTTMIYRINDISLLALAQKSKSLRTLRLSGCDRITDVGLTWLSEGCKAMEELDLCHCDKVSDAGIRSIANGCHALTSIDISSCKLITDIGISSLSKGCPKLRIVKLHGIFLMTDPRLSIPKKGAKLEAWQTVIGVSALAEHCPFIESLDLSGCFRLNIALHQYISTFKYVTTLNLSGCNQCSTEALDAVAKGCNSIEELNLSDCGKCVNNKSIQAFAIHCKNMKILLLCRCTLISGGAIKAISSFRLLEKLDLSGCKSLTDTMLIYLTEVDRVPKLRTLSFIDLNAITDSFLAWLSIKAHNILLIALKGTSISKKAIMSVRDRYPNSEFLQNENFYGFWPKYRVDDRILLNKYYNVIDGIIKIQSRLRKYVAIIKVSKINEIRQKNAAQLLLQRIIRGYVSRCKVKLLREKILKINNAAKIITTIFYIAIANKIVLRRKIVLLQQYRNKIIVKIQLCWRKYRDYKKLLVLYKLKQIWLQKRQYGTLKLQSVARIYFSRNVIRKMKALKRTKEIVQIRKANLIQRNYRGYIARKEALRLSLIIKRYKELLVVATIKIQRKIRYLRTCSIIQSGIEYKKIRLRSCIMIQSVMRGSLARIHVAEILTELNEKKKTDAIIKLQTRARMYKASLDVNKRRNERDRIKANHNFAANIIIHAAKRKLAYILYRKKQLDRRIRIKEIIQQELISICKIQALYRGMKGREKFNNALRAKKGKWKELFDEKVQKRFFYNKLSGEIRWRMPQDLLDLIPHPYCDNCCNKKAILECHICNELYCSSCFDHVHSGGRRKEHLFRTLYDYYGKRMDYGDGEFPCKWPSEVIQDEIQGWMLRVAPTRIPIKIYSSGWEEYKDHDHIMNQLEVSLPSSTLSHLKGNGSWNKLDYDKHIFYFNRKTFETTYDIPQEVIIDQEEEEKKRLREVVEQQRISEFAQTNGYYDNNGKWINTGFHYGSSTHSNDPNENNEQYNYDNTNQINMNNNTNYSPNSNIIKSSYSELNSISKVKQPSSSYIESIQENYDYYSVSQQPSQLNENSQEYYDYKPLTSAQDNSYYAGDDYYYNEETGEWISNSYYNQSITSFEDA